MLFVDKQIQPKCSLVTWLITLLLIICPSLYKARPDNFIGPNSSCLDIVFPQPRFPRLAWLPAQFSPAHKKKVGKFGLGNLGSHHRKNQPVF